MCQSAFCFISDNGTNIIYNSTMKGGGERSDKKNRERMCCLCLPHQGHPFCWIKYFRLIEVGFSLLLFPSITPSPFPLSPLITRPSAAAPPPSPSCFSLHIPLLILLLIPLSLPLPPFWGAADAVAMATIGSMFVWYVCDPLITLLAGDNNGTSRLRPQTEGETHMLTKPNSMWGKYKD